MRRKYNETKNGLEMERYKGKERKNKTKENRIFHQGTCKTWKLFVSEAQSWSLMLAGDDG